MTDDYLQRWMNHVKEQQLIESDQDEWRLEKKTKPVDREQKAKEKKEYGKRRYQSNEKFREQLRQYSLSHPKEKREMTRQWFIEHPEKSVEYRGKRRARKFNCNATLTPDEWKEIKELFDYRCAYCGTKLESPDQDHVIPLSKGGHHSADNVVPACKKCNSTKHNSSLLAFLLRIRKRQNAQ